MQHSGVLPISSDPLPPRFLSRLAGFADLFTRPTWSNVLVLLAGVILAPGRRTVTTALRILGRDRDPDRSSKGHFVKASGLRWLSAMLLVRVPWADHNMALPFLTLLAPSKRFYAGKSRAPKTLLDWARQAALQIHRWLPG